MKDTHIPNRLATVEASRGLAALAVVLFHANTSAAFIGADTWPLLTAGERGVDFFFVLSGFIISFVHSQDIGQPEKAQDYLAKRFLRLFPLLWIVVAPWIVLKTAIGEPPSLAEAGASLLLYPSTAEPMPLVIWTLRHEILFYLAFVLLIVRRDVGVALFVVWTAGCLAQVALSLFGAPVGGLAAFFLSPYQLDFMFGIGVAALHRRFVFARSWRPLSAALVLMVSALGCEQLFSIPPAFSAAWTVGLGLCFAVLLHGVLCLEGHIRVPRPLVFLGSASYALYLAHTPVNTVSQRIAALLPPELAIAIIVAGGLAAGIWLHVACEKPLALYLRRVLTRGRASPNRAAPAPMVAE